jgi:hypothetical protein
MESVTYFYFMVYAYLQHICILPLSYLLFQTSLCKQYNHSVNSVLQGHIYNLLAIA